MAQGLVYTDAEMRMAQAAERKKRALEQAAESYKQLTGREGKMVGGQYVAPHFLERLNDLVGYGMSQYEAAQAAKAEREGAASEMSAAQSYLKQAPRSTERPVDLPLLARPDEQGNVNPDIGATQTTPPSREERGQYLEQGMVKHPSIRSILEKQYAKYLEEPEKEAERADKAARLEEERLDRIRKENKPSIVHGPYGGIFAVDPRAGTAAPVLGTDGKPVMLPREKGYSFMTDEEGNVTAVNKANPDEQVTVGNVGRPTQKAGAGAGKPLTAKQQADLDAFDAMKTGLDLGVSKLDKATDKGLGYIAGLAQEKLPGGQSIVRKFRDKATNDAIQALDYTIGEIKHGRFGASFTGPEKQQAATYMPSEYDDLQTIKDKAAGLQELINLTHKRLRNQEAMPPPGTRPGVGPTGSWGDEAPQPAGGNAGTVKWGDLK